LVRGEINIPVELPDVFENSGVLTFVVRFVVLGGLDDLPAVFFGDHAARVSSVDENNFIV
jgi:hypothetical protein